MRNFVKRYKRLLPGAALAAVLALCAWTFGWFGGDINVMDFTAEEVESMELYHYWLGEEAVAVTEKADMQALIDEINGFRHTGKIFRYPEYWVPSGGDLPYECRVSLHDGGSFWFSASLIKEGAAPEDTELCYGGRNTCRGSLELFRQLHEKYSAEDPA